jgi:restriction endonuclease Mrr
MPLNASKGVFVTTSYFTKPAEEFAERHPYKVVLFDGGLLARLMRLACESWKRCTTKRLTMSFSRMNEHPTCQIKRFPVIA